MANLNKIKLPNGTTYNLKDDISGYSKVSVTQTQTSGTAIGNITINGTATTLYAPAGGGSTTIRRWS